MCKEMSPDSFKNVTYKLSVYKSYVYNSCVQRICPWITHKSWNAVKPNQHITECFYIRSLLQTIRETSFKNLWFFQESKIHQNMILILWISSSVRMNLDFWMTKRFATSWTVLEITRKSHYLLMLLVILARLSWQTYCLQKFDWKRIFPLQ